MAGHLDFEMRWGPGRPRPREGGPGDAFDVVVVADLGGGAGPLLRIDAETFDEVFAHIAPRAEVAGAAEDGGSFGFTPETLGDFHPDRLLRILPALSALRRLAEAAADPRAFADSPGSAAAAVPARPEADDMLLERLIGRKPESAASRGVSPLDAFIRGIVAPHLTPGPTPRQREVQDAIAMATVGRLRDVLRQEAFRRLEATWTAVRRLAFRIESDGPVRLHLLSISRDALVADAAAAGDDGVPPALRVALDRGITDGTVAPRGLLVFDVEVEATTAHLALVARLGALARAVGIPSVAAAAPMLLGADNAPGLEEPTSWVPPAEEVARLWSALRSSSLASWIGLATPRLLARPPYGARIEPVDGLDFEEAADDPGPDGFTWMNGAFARGGGAAPPPTEGEPEPLTTAGRAIDDLPFVAYSVADGRKLQPAAEAVLSDRAADAILAAGIVPLRAVPSRASVVVPRLQSIADPPAALGG